MTSQNLFAQQQSNRRRSALLVAGFLLFFAWIGFGGDLSYYLISRDAPPGAYHHDIPFLGIVTVALAAVVAWSSWKRGARRVLWATGAWKVVEAATPEQRRLVNVVEEMSIASGVPKPTVWIVPDSDPNAFATGVDPRAAHIAVTEGMLATLNRDELQGVVAHEMAHIQNPVVLPSERTDFDIPEEIDTIIVKCLEKEAADRYQTIDELAEAFLAVPVDEPWTRARAREAWVDHGFKSEDWSQSD